jgi:aminoglycoside phosphotransferase (APT) family kinase protein
MSAPGARGLEGMRRYPIEFRADWIEHYLSTRLFGGTKVKVLKIERFERGASRETWSVTYAHGTTAAPAAVIFRIDMPGGSVMQSPLREEYLMYERLGRTAVPVAKALIWEEDPQWTRPDFPFYVREQIEGSWNVPHFLDPDPAYDELRIEISKEHLRKLALVHTVDWRAHGFGEVLPVPKNAADAPHLFVERIRQGIEDVPDGDAHPLVLEAVEWFHDHAPPAPRLCLCKGTNGYGEEVFRGREIVAMSDWEESSIGDPASDLATCQLFTQEVKRDGRLIWGIQQALDYYESVSGITVLPAAVDFYGMVRGLSFVLFGQRGARSIAEHGGTDMRKAWAATETLHIGKRLIAASIGLMPPPTAERLSELHESVA